VSGPTHRRFTASVSTLKTPIEERYLW